MVGSLVESCSLDLTSNPREIELVLERLDEILEKTGLEELAAFRFRCAVVEIVNNCIQHAYRGEPGNPIKINFHLQAERLALVVQDRGPKFTGPAKSSQSDPLAESGRGIEIIKAGVNKIEYSRKNGWNYCRFELAIS